MMQGFWNYARPQIRRAMTNEQRGRARNILRGWMNGPLVSATSGLAWELRVRWVSRRSEWLFREVATEPRLKLHLGCGDDVRPGWLNVDCDPFAKSALDPGGISGFINYDLRLGLPLRAETCDLIYSSHFFEHLHCRDGVRLMRDCYAALAPGGRFRIALPDLKSLIAAYLRGDQAYLDLLNVSELLPDVEPGTETTVDYLNYGLYQYGEHKCIYDEDKLRVILSRIGFNVVESSSYKPGLDPESELRRRYSFYVEARK